MLKSYIWFISIINIDAPLEINWFDRVSDIELWLGSVCNDNALHKVLVASDFIAQELKSNTQEDIPAA